MPDDINPRTSLLARATKLVNGDRNDEYGSPAENLAHTADLWNAMFESEWDGSDVALHMILLKMSRLRHTPAHEDSWVDIAGWAAVGWECVVYEQEDDPPGEEIPLKNFPVEVGVVQKIAVDG